MQDENSVDAILGSGLGFKPHMNDVYLEAFKNQTFNKDGIENAILKIKPCNPPGLVLEHLPVKEKVRNIEVNRTWNSYNINTFYR